MTDNPGRKGHEGHEGRERTRRIEEAERVADFLIGITGSHDMDTSDRKQLSGALQQALNRKEPGEDLLMPEISAVLRDVPELSEIYESLQRFVIPGDDWISTSISSVGGSQLQGREDEERTYGLGDNVTLVQMRGIEDPRVLDATLEAARSAALGGERVLLNFGSPKSGGQDDKRGSL